MRPRTLALLPLLVALTGCLHAERVIIVNADGSGSIVDTINPTGPMAAMLAMQDAQKKESEKAEKTGRFKAAATAMGVRFDSYQPLGEGKPEVVKYSFSNIAAVKTEMLPFFGNDKEEAVSKTPLSFRFGRQGGRSVLTVLTPPEPKTEEKKPTPAELDAKVAEIKQMSSMLKGMRMVGKLQVGGPIGKTNSTFVEERTVTLLDLDFEAMAGDEASLRKLALVDDPTKADPKMLAGIKGLKVNTLPELTVEFGGK